MHPRTLLLCPALLGLLLASPAPAAAQGVAGELRTLSGARPVRLTGWGPAGPEIGGRPAPADWMEILFDPGRPEEAPWVVELAGGDWLPGAPGGGQGDEAFWRTPQGVAVPLDLLWVRRLARGQLRVREQGDRDLLWLKTGSGIQDRRRGWLLGWHAEGLEFEGVDRAQRFSWDRIAALQLLEEEVESLSDGVWLLLKGGGRLPCRPRGIDGDSLLADLPWTPGWRVPLHAVAALQRRGPPILELALRAPAAMRGPDSEALDWTPRLGRSVEGRPLRVAGREYPTGIGTRVPAEIRFEGLGPGFFLCKVGVDDEVLGFRNPQPVRFRVLLDDEEIAVSGLLQAGDAPQELAAPLTRAGSLRLVAEPADELPFGGHADWLDPVFLPAGAAILAGRGSQ